MAALLTPRRKKRTRLYDLVREAGVDVEDWKKSSKNPNRVASNPKYCYEWAFLESGQVAVLSLWQGGISAGAKGSIQCKLNIRKFATDKYSSIVVRRARSMDRVLAVAHESRLPVRAIVSDGAGNYDPSSSPARPYVKNRWLDDQIWRVVAYDQNTGNAVVQRGADSKYIDQFTDDDSAQTRTKTVTQNIFERSSTVRLLVLERAAGKCEWCDEPGFRTVSGKIYLETHHIVPLSEKGLDRPVNVIALCPNDHRQAHYGEEQEKWRHGMLARVRVNS
jgi:5-methylcytosine-specific restriction protein A